MRLSLCMIVKDEAFFIEECLASAAPFVDEVVVVDTGSTDGTREIAERYAGKVLDFEWIDDFSAARNIGLAAATGDWILVLDADERIAAEDYPKLREAMSTSEFDGYYLIQRNYSDEELQLNWIAVTEPDEWSGPWTGYTENPILRLFRRNEFIGYEGSIHEIVDGTISGPARGTLDLPIHHYVDANPARSRLERASGYLVLMDRLLEERDDGRIYGIAGSTALNASKDYAKAASYFRRAAELGYESLRSLEGAAEAAYRGGNYGEAQDLYRRLYDDGHRTASLCLNLANLAVRSGDKPRGAQLLEECLSLGGMGPQTDETIRRNIEFLSA
ncbi:glycosyltransferase [Congregibacter brevis]|uniref:Glycosyltransferase n=1 Tax=Congregibacter brevis TaxID=3081201 RepID=A0ABZ0IGT7_9GAMM|nr:glycosyltransferase [Congregibacter sp. IMCC45268]